MEGQVLLLRNYSVVFHHKNKKYYCTYMDLVMFMVASYACSTFYVLSPSLSKNSVELMRSTIKAD